VLIDCTPCTHYVLHSQVAVKHHPDSCIGCQEKSGQLFDGQCVPGATTEIARCHTPGKASIILLIAH
jgi:hypothetical protein